MLKIVLDTNLIIDGADDFYNYGSRIIDNVISGNLEAFANRATLRENKLLSLRKITDENYLRKLEYFFELVKPVDTSHLNLRIVEDPEDSKILESAVAADADYLITSDKHLLRIEKYQDVKIVRPSEFWSRWQEEGEGGWQGWLKSFIE
jgi:putative PIN family toxin of toxin-antitoxin system